ncbi:MAG: DUF2156 domain-containing protein [bacterium]
MGFAPQPIEAHARARALIMVHGWNATAYQILNPGISHWFASGGDSVVGYVTEQNMRVVAGAPVCAPERLREVVAEFDEDSRRRGLRVCYFGAGERLESLLMDRGGWSVASLGAQPSWAPADWGAIIARKASLRAQLNRARNKGVSIREHEPRSAEANPALQRVLDEWLGDRPLPSLHFLIEPDTMSDLGDRRVFVAERQGATVGFIVASPVPARNGWLIEQIIRGHGAVNGTAELLLDTTMRALAASGSTYVTLGLSPLSRHSRFDTARMPHWLRLTLRFVRAHGRRFYNFEGLDTFKSKFEPQEWEEIVAIANAPSFPWRALWAIAAAFTSGSPVWLIVRALAKGARQEWRWFRAARARRRLS